MTVIEALSDDIDTVVIDRQPMASTVHFHDREGREIANRHLNQGDIIQGDTFHTRECMRFWVIREGNTYRGWRT
jgi:hypothetical protein